MSSSCTFPSSVPTIPEGHDLQARDRTNTLDNDHPLLGMYSQERKGGIGPSMMIVDVYCTADVMKDAGELVGGVTLSGAMLKEARWIIVTFLRLRCGQIADTASFCCFDTLMHRVDTDQLWL